MAAGNQKLAQVPSKAAVHGLRMNCYRLQRQVYVSLPSSSSCFSVRLKLTLLCCYYCYYCYRYDMETFLSDYGMIWVGNDDDDANLGQTFSSQSDDVNTAVPGTADGVASASVAPLMPQSGGGVNSRPTAAGTLGQAAAAKAAAEGSSGLGPPDIDRLAAKVFELNGVAGADEITFQRVGGGIGPGGGDKGFGPNMMQPVKPTVLPLKVYRDGFTFSATPGDCDGEKQLSPPFFRPYGDPSATLFMADMLDGYFPYELKDIHPDGCPFALEDNSFRSYLSTGGASGGGAPGTSFQAFEGVGQTLGGDAEAMDRRAPGVGGGATAVAVAGFSARAGLSGAATAGGAAGSAGAAGGPPSGIAVRGPTGKQQACLDTSDAFLRRLPASVIRNGQIINVREEVSGLMGKKGGGTGPGSGGGPSGGTSDCILVPTPFVQNIQSTLSEQQEPPGAASGSGGSDTAGASLRPATASVGKDITTLQVRMEGGNQRLILKLGFDDPVSEVYGYVSRYRLDGGGVGAGDAFSLRTAFPSRAYPDSDVTLRSCGLVPNAVLLVSSATVAPTCDEP